MLIAGIGLAGSYAAVRTLALHKGFGGFTLVFPISNDAQGNAVSERRSGPFLREGAHGHGDLAETSRGSSQCVICAYLRSPRGTICHSRTYSRVKAHGRTCRSLCRHCPACPSRGRGSGILAAVLVRLILFMAVMGLCQHILAVLAPARSVSTGVFLGIDAGDARSGFQWRPPVCAVNAAHAVVVNPRTGAPASSLRLESRTWTAPGWGQVSTQFPLASPLCEDLDHCPARLSAPPAWVRCTVRFPAIARHRPLARSCGERDGGNSPAPQTVVTPCAGIHADAPPSHRPE